MSTEIALDLRAARRKAGYTQGEIAKLLDSHQSHISDLEKGRLQPSLQHIISLSLIYGRSFESYFSRIMDDCQEHLTARLSSLPPGNDTAGTFNRASSIKKLGQRLKQSVHGSA